MMKMRIFSELHRKVIHELREKLPSYLVYHDADHTNYVLSRAIYLAGKEGVKGYDLFLLKLASLYHDTGFMFSRDHHEQRSCDFAVEELRKAGLPSKDIGRVCGMIIATTIPQNPQNLPEKIMADADLEYLSTNRFVEQSERLFAELKHINPGLTRPEWYRLEIAFMEKHSYHTDYFRRVREPVKKRNIDKVRAELERITKSAY